MLLWIEVTAALTVTNLTWLRWVVFNQSVQGGRKIIFCSTSLPLANSWWVWSTLLSLCCPLLYEAGRLINLGNLNNFSSEKFWNRQESNPGQLGPEAQNANHCAMPPQCMLFLRFEILTTLFPDAVLTDEQKVIRFRKLLSKKKRLEARDAAATNITDDNSASAATSSNHHQPQPSTSNPIPSTWVALKSL